MKPRLLCLVLCHLAALLLASCTVLDREGSRQREAEEMNATMEIGSEIISAIEAYEDDYGRYPRRLEVLLPTYLSSIPTTSTGREFEYERDDLYGQGYYLCFHTASDPGSGCCFHRRLCIWDCSPGCE